MVGERSSAILLISELHLKDLFFKCQTGNTTNNINFD